MERVYSPGFDSSLNEIDLRERNAVHHHSNECNG
jgi:hypothetical protein